MVGRMAGDTVCRIAFITFQTHLIREIMWRALAFFLSFMKFDS